MKQFQIASFVEDDDFQDPIPMRNTKPTIISVGSERALKTLEKENDPLIRPEGWVCLPISSDERFQYLSSIEDTIYNWADNENIILVRSKFDDKRLSLTQMLNDKVLDLGQIALSLLESNTSWMENIGL
ncbi:hypothetical protein G6F56_013902 [Rhizopus delemar]|nr:hypothetical protein G6F56_013902 [Rhizopus delemar]